MVEPNENFIFMDLSDYVSVSLVIQATRRTTGEGFARECGNRSILVQLEWNPEWCTEASRLGY